MIALVRGVGRFKEASPTGPLQFRSFQNHCRIFADAISDFERFSERAIQRLRRNAGKHSEKNNLITANFTAAYCRKLRTLSFRAQKPPSGHRSRLRLRIPEKSQLKFYSMEVQKPLIRPGRSGFLTLVTDCLGYVIPLTVLHLAHGI